MPSSLRARLVDHVIRLLHRMTRHSNAVSHAPPLPSEAPLSEKFAFQFLPARLRAIPPSGDLAVDRAEFLSSPQFARVLAIEFVRDADNLFLDGNRKEVTFWKRESGFTHFISPDATAGMPFADESVSG